MVTSILFFIFCVALLWHAVAFAVPAYLKLHPSLRLLYPIGWPVKLLVPVGALLFLLQGMAKFIRDLDTAIKGREQNER